MDGWNYKCFKKKIITKIKILLLITLKLNIDYCEIIAVNSQEILNGEVEFTGAK